jgi:hypothetical protein
VRLRLLQHLLLQRCLPVEVHLLEHLVPQVWAQGEVEGADVVEGLLRERPLLVRRLLAWAWEAAVRQRLRHRACWAASSWWLTSSDLDHGGYKCNSEVGNDGDMRRDAWCAARTQPDLLPGIASADVAVTCNLERAKIASSI